MAERVIKLLLGFAVSVAMARHLGDEDYGKFNYVLSFVGLWAPFYVFGTEESTMTRLVSQLKDSSVVLTSSLLVKVCGGLLGLFFILVSAFIWAPPWSHQLILIYGLFFFFQIFVTFHHFFLVQAKGYYDALWKTFVLFFISLSKLIFIYFNLSWESFVYISCAELLFFGFVHIFTFKKYSEQKFTFSFEREKFAELFKCSLPIFFFLLFDQALVRIDQVMIGSLIGDAPLGQYAVASKLVNLWNFVPILALSTLLPILVRTFETENKKFEKLNQTIIGGFFFISVVFGLSVTLIADELIGFLYGDTYKEAASILKIYSWFPLVNYFILFRSKVFIVTGEISLAVQLSFLTILINILLNLYLIPLWGSPGAIYSSVLAFISSTFVYSLFSQSVRGSAFHFLRSLYRCPIDFMNLLKVLK